MPLLKKILQKLDGLRFSQDYLCFEKESFQQTLFLYLTDGDKVQEEVTGLHAFVGYCPVLLAFSQTKMLATLNEIKLVFTQKPFLQNQYWQKSDAVAFLQLKKIKLQATPDGRIVYFKATHGGHRFTSNFHQLVGQWQNNLYNRKPGNVYLPGNLFKQVQIAYALPRKISLISVATDGRYNLFPTDLHGRVAESYYVISLRHAGKACEQVQHAGRIVLSDMEAAAYKDVYRLGKNHMQPFKDGSAFPFSSSCSSVFQLLLPTNAVAYKELELIDSFTEGIHRLFLFKIVNAVQLTDARHTLVHVHAVYATWRQKQGLPGNYLLR